MTDETEIEITSEQPMGDPAPPNPTINNNGPLTAAKAAALVDKIVS